MPDAQGNVKGISVPAVPWHGSTVNQRKLIDHLLVKRPSVRMWIQPTLDRGLSRQQASDLIDWLRAGAKGKAPDLSGEVQ